MCRYVHPLNKNTIYRHAWGGGGREVAGGGGVVGGGALWKFPS